MDTLAKKHHKPASPAGQEKPAEALQPTGQLQDDELIILPVRRMVLFPGATVPIAIGRPKSIMAIEAAIRAGQPIGVVMQREAEIADPGPEDLFRVGTLAKIIRHMPTGNGAHHLICEGLQRIRLKAFRPGLPFLVARYSVIREPEERSAEIDARFLQLKERALEALSLLEGIPQDFINTIAAIDRPSALADRGAEALPGYRTANPGEALGATARAYPPSAIAGDPPGARGGRRLRCGTGRTEGQYRGSWDAG